MCVGPSGAEANVVPTGGSSAGGRKGIKTEHELKPPISKQTFQRGFPLSSYMQMLSRYQTLCRWLAGGGGIVRSVTGQFSFRYLKDQSVLQLVMYLSTTCMKVIKAVR